MSTISTSICEFAFKLPKNTDYYHLCNHFCSQCTNNNEYDVAIVGGGISGLYCALKLLEKSESVEELDIKKMIILEKSDRWGGRLDTDIIPLKGTDGETGVVKEEEGAMRFTYPDKKDPESKSNMPLLAALIKDLQMEDHVFPFFMTPQDLSGGQVDPVPNCNTRYIYGRFFTAWYALQNPSVLRDMFSLEGDEQFKSADKIVKDIYRKLLDHNKAKLLVQFPKIGEVIWKQMDTNLLQEYLNPDYWDFFRNEFTWKVGMQETSLNQFSMTTMNYSEGCLNMMVEMEGYLGEGNAGCFIQLLISFDLIWNKIYQLKNGWSSLVEKIVEKVYKKDGVVMNKSCGVSMISEETAYFKLTLKPPRVTKTENKDMRTILAKHVVMAVPPKSVEDITFTFNDSTNWEKIESNICQSIDGVHLTKINLYFKNDWWNQTKNTLMYGPNITSLPCESIYPFYGECKAAGCKGCDKCNDHPCPAALTIYCRINSAEFWSSLQRLGHPFQSTLQTKRCELLPASESVVSEAIKQFSKVFNIRHIPQPVLTSYKSWDGRYESKENGRNYFKSDQYHGYATHRWGLGVDDREIMKEATQPIKGKNLYFCNEAWSGYQGWVEGSLQSTEKVVQMLD